MCTTEGAGHDNFTPTSQTWPRGPLSTECDPEKDYYEVLGVDQHATAREIKRVFRKLVKKYHPDVYPDDPGGIHFKEIYEARDVLLDEQRRREYDEARSSLGRRRTVVPTGGSGAGAHGSEDAGGDWTPTPPAPPRTPPGSDAQTPGPDGRTRGKPNSKARRLIALSITTVMVVVLVVLSLTAFSSAPGPAATDEAAVAKAEATTVNSVLDSSTSSQAEFLNAINNVKKCIDLTGSVSQISQVLGQRASELNEASGLATWALPNGLPLRSYLVETIRMYRHANEIFLSWAEEVRAHGCTPTNLRSSTYNEGATLFQDAVIAQVNFIKFWEPVASKDGFQPRSKASF
jgi:hypothetical protein